MLSLFGEGAIWEVGISNFQWRGKKNSRNSNQLIWGIKYNNRRWDLGVTGEPVTH